MNTGFGVLLGFNSDGKLQHVTDKELEAQRRCLQEFEHRMGEIYYDMDDEDRSIKGI